MSKVAIVVLCDTDTFEDLGRAFNAMMAVKEFKDAGDDVRLIFDGAGTKWIAELAKPDHKAHGLFRAVRDKVVGACSFCSGIFQQEAAIKTNDVRLLNEYEGHPSFKKLVSEGYTVITF